LKGDDGTQEVPVLAATIEKPHADEARQRVAELYALHHERVFQAAWRVTGNASDAEDVLQAVFLRMLRREDDSIPSEAAGAYLQRAAVNAAVDLIRRRKAAKTDPIDERHGALAALGPDPSAQHETREAQRRVREALAGLTPRAAEIFVLRYFEGHGNREIARMLGTSWSTVAVTLHRARTRVRKSLSGGLR
jgi:RNA polymerase sigma-70 factor (ECF subfamily)